MKKIMARVLLFLLITSSVLTGCGVGNQKSVTDNNKTVADNDSTEEASDNAEAAASDDAKKAEEPSQSNPRNELLQDIYNDYKESGGQIAFVLCGTLMDGSYNEDIYQGIQVYALSAGISFSTYVASEDSPEEYRKTMERAIADKARIIVCEGYVFGETVAALEKVYPEVAFLLVDGVPVDANGESVVMSENVHCVSFHEEESGYIAGYMAVLEGYRKFGFIGGADVPSVVRYGYGYIQGINDAAAHVKAEDVTVNYWYAQTFEPNNEISKKASEWYEDGTEIIFACGGSLYESVLEAADREDRWLIGVDVDQSGISERFLTSAIKDTSNAVIAALDDFYATGMQWSPELAGQEMQYSIQEDCTGIPLENTEWRFQNITTQEVYDVYGKIKLGEILISNKTDEKPNVSFKVNYDEAGE